MRNIIIGTLFTLITSLSFSQMDKSTCETIIKSIDLASFQKVKVYINSNGESVSSSYFNLETSNLFISFEEKHLYIKDSDGVNLYIPYNTIKLIKTEPKKGSELSSVMILLF